MHISEKLSEINRISKEIELLYKIDKKFIIGNWYSHSDSYRVKEYIFKVVDITPRYIRYHSIDGTMELIDPQSEPNSFAVGSKTYNESKSLSFDDAFRTLMNRIKELASQ